MSDVRRIFRDLVNRIKARQNDMDDIDMSGNAVKRRMAALQKAYDKHLADRYGEDEELCHYYVVHQMISRHTYDSYDEQHNISRAAAMWVLNELERNGNFHEAMKLLPSDYKEYMDFFIPDAFVYPMYDQDIVRAMMSVLQNRNGESYNFFVDDYAAKGKKAECEERKRYDALMELLDRDRIELACSRFKEAQDDLQDRIIQCYRRLLRERRSIEEQMIRDRPSMPLMFGFSDLMEDADYMSRIDEIEDRLRKISVGFGALSLMEYDDILSDFKLAKVAKLINGFQAADPFETCFALMYLLDSGDDAPWLYGSGLGVVVNAAGRLPWRVEPDDYLYGLTGDEDDYCDWHLNRRNWKEDQKKREEEGTLRGASEFLDKRFHDYSMAQYLYQLTGVVMPRGVHPFEAERDEFIAEGMPVEDADRLIDLAEYAFLREFQTEDVFDYHHIWDKEIEEDESDEEEELVEEEASMEPDPEVYLLKQEIKLLRDSFHKVSRAAYSAEQQLEKERENAAIEHRELADLREYVFNQTREDAEKTERIIEYPYLTKHKIVVVGGHETFLKAIIPKLPNVRFIHRDELEDASIIRNADVVWFQTNSVPHKQFYRVINTARKHHIPVRYLAFASAEKCAEQIVTEDER